MSVQNRRSLVPTATAQADDVHSDENDSLRESKRSSTSLSMNLWSFIVARTVGRLLSVISIVVALVVFGRGSQQMSDQVACVPKPNVTMRSQAQEDAALLDHYFSKPYKCGGTVVEMGALDGMTSSNSYYFEYALGWKSVLIEALPANYDRLVQNRPGAITIHAAACEGKSTQFLVGRAPSVGGVSSAMTEQFKTAFIQDFSTGAQVQIQVPCRTLRDLFKEHKITHIHLFSLDVEGSELETLLTMDLQAVRVDVWLIEVSGSNATKDDAVRQLLHSNGYEQETWNLGSYCTGTPNMCTVNEVFVPTREKTIS